MRTECQLSVRFRACGADCSPTSNTNVGGRKLGVVEAGSNRRLSPWRRRGHGCGCAILWSPLSERSDSLHNWDGLRCACSGRHWLRDSGVTESRATCAAEDRIIIIAASTGRTLPHHRDLVSYCFRHIITITPLALVAWDGPRHGVGALGS